MNEELKNKLFSLLGDYFNKDYDVRGSISSPGASPFFVYNNNRLIFKVDIDCFTLYQLNNNIKDLEKNRGLENNVKGRIKNFKKQAEEISGEEFLIKYKLW